jgi:hypothetical protein
LAHRELHLRADLMREVADADPDAIPKYVADFQTLVGSRALKYWLFGPSARALATVPPPGRSRSEEPERPAPAPTPEPVAEPAPEPAPPPRAPDREKKPEVHAAFADLMGPELRASTIPPELDMDELEEDEPIVDEDWLDDESLEPSYSRPASPARSVRVLGERHAEPPPAAEDDAPPDTATDVGSDGVDFAGLLTEEEDSGEFLVEDEEMGFDLEDEEEVFGGALGEDARAVREQTAGGPDPADATGEMVAGAEHGLEVIGDQVILRHRVEPSEADLYDPARSELWIQLHAIDRFPLTLLMLIADPEASDPNRLWWPLDLRLAAHREVAQTLRRSFRAEVRLVDQDLEPLRSFEIEGPRELNAAVVLGRAKRALEDLPPGDELYEAAVRAVSSLSRPLGTKPPPPLDTERLPPPNGLEDTRGQLETLAEWTTGERRDELVLVRSFPLDHLEAIAAELIGSAVERGIALPEPMAERAVESGHAADRGRLAARLLEAFDSWTSESGAVDLATAQNWKRLLEDCARWDVEPDAGARERAEKVLARHGLLDEN